MYTYHADTLIVGSGLAGLMLAYSLSQDQHVICLTKAAWQTCNSYKAQGGIAGVTTPDDSYNSHINDTLLAGRYHNNFERVATLIQNSPQIIERLIQLGVPFDTNAFGELARTKEGGHSTARILHSGGDATGKNIMTTLKSQLPDHVSIHDFTQGIDLLIKDGICCGVWAKNSDNQLLLYTAKHIVLATGGVGQLYERTSNAITITGDGIALAYQAGAGVTDMEFIQFHPTLLQVPGLEEGILISEAVRGEGAVIVNQNGEAILKNAHPLKDLAPRDIVARALYKHFLKGDTLFLDITKVHHFKQRFPSIYAMCQKAGISLENKKIPISPGAHFIMGGIEVDADGRTSIKGLYAIGEAACTGIHGANRLASNSLLEAVDSALSLAGYINACPKQQGLADHHRKVIYLERQRIHLQYDAPYRKVKQLLPSKQAIQAQVTHHCGILRNSCDLLELIDWLKPIIDTFSGWPITLLNPQEAERWHMITVAWLMATSMLERQESRGAHYRSDFPDEQEAWLQKRIKKECGIYEYY
ncbi:L-aspartate oxidase [Pullulanibacillus camelliae]|uniref:L-aspartate oxidase n=1 Tax=Pullulanibacillus camelliae TaxID=1707096 RepID=A0A8J2VHB8_9BACL|nr:L-aspartate oxidase [Pullulanibacillus camelliae]GGE30609.1 L-aspartate oxidase [Pullulanibacillus camelliae]